MHLLTLLLIQAPADPPPQLSMPRIVPDCAEERAAGRILVCGRSDADSPYRLPEPLRSAGWDPKGPVRSVSRERNGLLVGESDSLGSCSTVGPNGMNGCHAKGVWRKREQKGQ